MNRTNFIYPALVLAAMISILLTACGGNGGTFGTDKSNDARKAVTAYLDSAGRGSNIDTIMIVKEAYPPFYNDSVAKSFGDVIETIMYMGMGNAFTGGSISEEKIISVLRGYESSIHDKIIKAKKKIGNTKTYFALVKFKEPYTVKRTSYSKMVYIMNTDNPGEIADSIPVNSDIKLVFGLGVLFEYDKKLDEFKDFEEWGNAAEEIAKKNPLNNFILNK